MTLPTYHIWHDTSEGRLPFTYFVFGPYLPFSAPEYDVEIYSGHINDEERLGANYLGTVSSLPRNTHVVIDVWDWMDANV
jgi:hypothetical protein